MAAARGDKRRRLALFCCLGAGFGTLLDSAVIAFAVPGAAESLGADVQQVQWFLASYSLTFGLGLVPAGRLGDVVGRRGPLLLGLVLFLIGGVVSATAGQIWVSVAGRALQGFGAGVISAQVLGIIQDEFVGPGRVRALSGYSMASAAAAMAGPVLAAGLLEVLPWSLAWRGILALHIPFILATTLLAWGYRPAAATGDGPSPNLTPLSTLTSSQRPSMDLPGVLLLGALVTLATLPVIDPVLTADSILLVALAAPALLVALILWERHYRRTGRQPLFLPELMAAPGYLLGTSVAALWFGSVLAKSTVLVLYLLDQSDLAPIVVGLLLVPGALARIGAAVAAAAVHRRLGPVTIPVALGLEAFSVLVLVIGLSAAGSGPVPSVPVLSALVVAFAVLSGLGSGVTEPILRARTLSRAPAGHYGVAASFLQLAQRLSGTFLVALASGLLLAGSGARMGTALLVSLVALLLAGAISWASRTLRAGEPGG